jgi:two-component system KDP operon response regulator KdpE
MMLTPREYDLLRLLITHAGKVITHQHLLRAVWGQGSRCDPARK